MEWNPTGLIPSIMSTSSSLSQANAKIPEDPPGGPSGAWFAIVLKDDHQVPDNDFSSVSLAARDTATTVCLIKDEKGFACRSTFRNGRKYYKAQFFHRRVHFRGRFQPTHISCQ